MSVFLVIENEFDNFDNFLYFLMQDTQGLEMQEFKLTCQ